MKLKLANANGSTTRIEVAPAPFQCCSLKMAQ